MNEEQSSLEADSWTATDALEQEVERLRRILGEKDAALDKAEAELEVTRRTLLERELQLGECQKRVQVLELKNQCLEEKVNWLFNPISMR